MTHCIFVRMQVIYVTNRVAEAITYFANLTSYFSGYFLSVSTRRSSTASNNFVVFVGVFVIVYNSNYLKLITMLTDACKNGKFLPVLSTKTFN
jgi:hypothetical protein